MGNKQEHLPPLALNYVAGRVGYLLESMVLWAPALFSRFGTRPNLFLPLGAGLGSVSPHDSTFLASECLCVVAWVSIAWINEDACAVAHNAHLAAKHNRRGGRGSQEHSTRLAHTCTNGANVA